MSVATTPHLLDAASKPRHVSWPRRVAASAWLWLSFIVAGQIALALRPGANANAFEDEGLYVYTGHRMIEHLLHGAHLSEYPGAFFSGAPGLFPVLAAMADHVGGLAAARDVSLGFAGITTIAMYGLGNRLFGRAAGLLGAAAFAVCGSVIYISHFATYDAMTMALVAVGAWLAVRSAQRDGFAWAPMVALIMTVAFLAKYAGAVYLPIVVALGAVVGWPLYGAKVLRRALFCVISAGVMTFAAIELWGRSMIPGIESTTSSRVVLHHASAGFLGREVVMWVGPWLVLAAAAAALRFRRQWALMLVLLAGAVVGPVDQMRIGEATSLAKHVAYGMVFAAPLVGDVFARFFRRGRLLAVPAIAAAMAVMVGSGLFYSHQFTTGWVNDAPLRPVLAHAIAAHPTKKILGERYAPQRYELRAQTEPNQWYDTYYFTYGGKVNEPAYAKAIDQHYFGVIYLDQTTPYGSYIYNYLMAHKSYYQLAARVPRVQRGQLLGHWYVFTPRTLGD